MTRVSENSTTASVKYAVNKTKSKLEDLQLKGTTLRDLNKPSDNPVSNVEALNLNSRTNNNKQYLKNADFALLYLSVTEQSIEQLTDILTKAKEIAIAQASDFYDGDIRKNVANEIYQLRNQALSISNKRIGQRYLFGGYATLESPFSKEGDYRGDLGRISLEVSKDFFVPVNLHGEEVFFMSDDTKDKRDHPLNEFPDMQNSPNHIPKKDRGDGQKILSPPKRELASIQGETNLPGFQTRDNILSQLDKLGIALENNDTSLIQGLLEEFDDAVTRLITLRTRVGAITNSVMNAKNTIESENIQNETRKSQLLDADVAELFSDIVRHQSILETTYKATQGLMNKNLLDFLK